MNRNQDIQDIQDIQAQDLPKEYLLSVSVWLDWFVSCGNEWKRDIVTIHLDLAD